METTTLVDPEFGALVMERGSAWKQRLALFAVVALCAAPVFGIAAARGEWFIAIPTLGVALTLMLLTHVLLAKVRLRIFERGIERRGPLGTKRMAWHDFERYQLTIVDSTAAAGAGAGGVIGALVAQAVVKAVSKNSELVPAAITLHGRNRERVVLSATIVDYKDLVKTLVPSLAERIFPSARLAYENGAEVSFGKKLTLQRGVGLTFTGLLGKKYVLPLEQAASATLERTVLVIRQSDTNGAWQTINASSLHNVGVLQRFIETAGKPHDERLPMAWTS